MSFQYHRLKEKYAVTDKRSELGFMKKYENFLNFLKDRPTNTTRLGEYDKKKNMNYELRAELKTPFKNAKAKRGKNNKAKREEVKEENGQRFLLWKIVNAVVERDEPKSRVNG